MAAQTPGYICLCLHHNHIFLAPANHGPPSPGLDLFKPEGKLCALLFKTAETRRAEFKAPRPGLLIFLKSAQPINNSARGGGYEIGHIVDMNALC